MMGMMNCREVEIHLDHYLDGTLSGWPRILFRLHLAMCSECRSYIAKYEVARTLTTSVFVDANADAATEVPEDLIKAILAARKASL